MRENYFSARFSKTHGNQSKGEYELDRYAKQRYTKCPSDSLAISHIKLSINLDFDIIYIIYI